MGGGAVGRAGGRRGARGRVDAEAAAAADGDRLVGRGGGAVAVRAARLVRVEHRAAARAQQAQLLGAQELLGRAVMAAVGEQREQLAVRDRRCRWHARAQRRLALAALGARLLQARRRRARALHRSALHLHLHRVTQQAQMVHRPQR